MKNPVSRRSLIKSVGIGAAMVMSQSTVQSAEVKVPDLARARANVNWGDRPMFLRAYHPPYLVYYYGAMRDNKIKSEASIIKWKSLIDRVENEPDLVIRIIEAYDDACAGCARLNLDPLGSVWGVGYTCTSVKDLELVRGVTLTCRRILGELDLYYGSEIKMRDLVPLLEKNVPVLYEYIGGEANQESYEKGLKYLKEKYGL